MPDGVLLNQEFSSKAACFTYIDSLPVILKNEGYPGASIDSLSSDSSSAEIDLFMGPKLQWITLNSDSVDPDVRNGKKM